MAGHFSVQCARARKAAQALFFLTLCFFAFAADATAGKKPPAPDTSMQFAVVRGSSPACEPVCPEWIWAEGEIKSDTAKRLKKFLKNLGKRKLPIVIQSPGGHVDAAFAMGRLIRAKGLDVAVGYTTFASCAPRQKGCKPGETGTYTGVAAAGFAYCNSACPMVLAGGVKRLVGLWAHLGVHQITTTMVKEKILYRTTTRVVKGKKVVKKKIVRRQDAGSYTTTKMGKGLRRQFTAYLNEMGVSTDILEPINKTPAAGILKLDQSELLTLKLITSLDQVDALTGPSICKLQPMPSNCREIPADQYQATKVATAKPAAAKPAGAQHIAALKTDAKPVDGGQNKVDRVVLAKLDSIGQMRFAVVRGSNPQCDPDCPEWISAEGRITSGTPERLRRLLDTIGERQLPIVISSLGGDVLAAVAAGRLIRERNLDVAVARTRFAYCTPETSGCAPDDGVFLGATLDAHGECGSPCPLMLAGGVRRLVGPNARVTMQSLGFGQRIVEYLERMAVEPALLSTMGPFKKVTTQLTPEVMAAVRLTTGAEAVDEWTAPGICRSMPRPKNCRAVMAAQ
jgi:hypothetical protein